MLTRRPLLDDLPADTKSGERALRSLVALGLRRDDTSGTRPVSAPEKEHDMHTYSNHTRPGARSWRLRAVATASLVAAAIGGSSIAVAGSATGQADLARVRAATAQFHRVEVAEASGHVLGWKNPDIPITGCVAHPTAGAMGYHWFDHDAIEDIALDPLEPEGLVYAPMPNGELRLVAVEWIVPADAWHAAGNEDAPRVLGQEMGILNPALGWYILHAWIWKPNPSGMFENWNPEVTCP